MPSYNAYWAEAMPSIAESSFSFTFYIITLVTGLSPSNTCFPYLPLARSSVWSWKGSGCFPGLTRLHVKHLTPLWYFLEVDANQEDELLVNQTHSFSPVLRTCLGWAFMHLLDEEGKTSPRITGKRQRFPVASRNAVAWRCSKLWNQMFGGHLSVHRPEKHDVDFILMSPSHSPCHRAPLVPR